MLFLLWMNAPYFSGANFAADCVIRHRVLSLTILCPNHRIAGPCGLTCKYLVAEKTTFV
jgi:hypothetical protein